MDVLGRALHLPGDWINVLRPDARLMVVGGGVDAGSLLYCSLLSSGPTLLARSPECCVGGLGYFLWVVPSSLSRGTVTMDSM